MEPSDVMSLRAWVEIDLGAVAANTRKLKSIIGDGTQLMAVVKANGYGHGASMVARTALENGASWLGVATVDEGMRLRDCGLDAPILILSPVLPQRVLDAVSHDLRLTVCSMDMIRDISGAAKQAEKPHARVHLKVDTGMTRVGVRPQDVRKFIARTVDYPNVNIEGVFTHFATADETDRSFVMEQSGCFQKVMEALIEAGYHIPLYHACNSAAILEYPEFSFDMVRAGIAIYGLYPSLEVRHDIELIPALEFKTRVIHVKRVSAGVSVGYGAKYVTDKSCVIATLGVGYADGFPRALSNKGVVLLNGMRLPVVGRVCMDQCMVQAPLDADINVGSEAVLIGCQGDETISADELASLMGTINYEVACMISSRVQRVYR